MSRSRTEYSLDQDKLYDVFEDCSPACVLEILENFESYLNSCAPITSFEAQFVFEWSKFLSICTERVFDTKYGGEMFMGTELT